MQFLRSFLFNILFYTTLVIVFILAIPTLILPNKSTLICGKILAFKIIFLLRLVLGIKVNFSGIENLKKHKKFFVASAHQSLLQKIKENIEKSNRPLLIFPQGTRVKFGERLPFKKGAGRIYEALNLPCVPVALNTGKVWPKNSFLKFNYDINISFLDPIEPGLDKNIFIKDLEAKIYSSIEKLN